MGLDSFLAFKLEHIPFVLLVLMISLTVHEFAHAYSADKFGDPTPRSMGRVTLDPRRHLDIFGTILFIIVGIGWAKPVLVNTSRFRNPRVMNVIVSFLGPFSNLLLGFIGVLVMVSFLTSGMMVSWSIGLRDAFLIFFQYFIQLNVLLFILNLLPLPPLDGYRILESVLPERIMAQIRPYEQWAFLVILLMIFITPIYNVTLRPIFSLTVPIIEAFNHFSLSIFT